MSNRRKNFKRERSASDHDVDGGYRRAPLDETLASLRVPPLAIATAANQLQHLQLSKHVECYLTERLLREFPKFVINDHHGNESNTAENNERLDEPLRDGQTANDTSSSGPKHASVPEEEDFFSSARGKQLLKSLLENSERENVVCEASATGDSQERQQPVGETHSIPTVRDTTEFDERDWERFYRAHAQFVLGADDEESDRLACEGTQLNLYKNTSLQKAKYDGREKRMNLLFRHYKTEWVPFAETHRHDSFISNPLSFLSDLSGRFDAWCAVLREGAVENCLRASSHNNSEDGRLFVATPKDSVPIVPFATYNHLHRPPVFAISEGTNAFDSTSFSSALTTSMDAQQEGKGESFSAQSSAPDGRIRFATLSCSNIGVAGFVPSATAVVGSRPRRTSKAIRAGGEEAMEAERELAVASEHHSALTRLLWAAAGGTKRASTTKRKANSTSKSRKLPRGKRRRDSDSDLTDSSDDEPNNDPEKDDDADEEGSTGLALAFGEGVLTSLRGSTLGVDDEGQIEGEVCLSGGMVRLRK